MILSCRPSLVHVQTAEVAPSVPAVDHEVSPVHSILTPLPDLLLGHYLSPVSFLVRACLDTTFHYKCFEILLLTKRKINASQELDLTRY